MFEFQFIELIIDAYPLPTPATYPKGAGIPKKCFLFLFAMAFDDILIK